MTSDQLAQLAELRELMEKISEGPWTAPPEVDFFVSVESVRKDVHDQPDFQMIGRVDVASESDAQFIALSRNLLPALLQERDEMLKEIREWHKGYRMTQYPRMPHAYKNHLKECKFCGEAK